MKKFTVRIYYYNIFNPDEVEIITSTISAKSQDECSRQVQIKKLNGFGLLNWVCTELKEATA